MSIPHWLARARVSILVLAALAGAPAWSQNLLDNGDFSASHPYMNDPTNPVAPAQPDDWEVTNSNSNQTAGGDWFQNSAFVTSSADYGSYPGVAANPVLAIYNLGSAQQTFDIAAGGAYRLTWDSAAPTTSGHYGNYMISMPEVRSLDVRVWLDGTQQVASFEEAIGQPFATHSVDFMLTPGQHTIEFRGLDAGEVMFFGGAGQYATQTVVHVGLLDNVVIAVVPELSSAGLLALGLAALVGWTAIRRRAGQAGERCATTAVAV